MNKKRVWLISLGVLVILAAMLVAAGFILPSVQAAREQSAPSLVQPAIQEQAAPAVIPVSAPDYKDYSGDGYSCGHDSASSLEESYLDQ